MNWHEAMQEARAHGISRKAMATEMGIHPQMLSRWERGERAVGSRGRAGYESILCRQVMILEQQGSEKVGESLATI